MIHSKKHGGCRIQDPGTRGKHQTKTKNPWCTRRGCRVQTSRPWDSWLPVVKNSRLFAKHAHSARCAPVEGGKPLIQFVRTPNAIEPPTNSNFGAFGGPMAPATWAKGPLFGSPWVLKYLYCHQMITQTHPKGDGTVSEKIELQKLLLPPPPPKGGGSFFRHFCPPPPPPPAPPSKRQKSGFQVAWCGGSRAEFHWGMQFWKK